MSDDAEFARLAARLLAQRPLVARTRGVERQQGVLVVSRAIQARARRKRLWRALSVGAGLAAAAATALVTSWFGSRHAHAVHVAAAACASGAECAAPALAAAATADGRALDVSEVRAPHGDAPLVRAESSAPLAPSAEARRGPALSPLARLEKSQPSDTEHAQRAQYPSAPEAKGGARLDSEEAQPAATKSSALSEQNDLYAQALGLRRAGHNARAIAVYDQVIARFPNGALAESASGERLLLLMKTAPQQARAEARAYLARYPRGFASREAERFLSSP